MPLQASRVLKQFKYAMYFDGVDDYVLKSSPSGFTSYEYTIMAWIRFTQLYSEAVNPRTWFVTNTWWGPILSELRDGNKLLLRIGTSSGKTDIISKYVFDKNWHHIALIVKSGAYGGIYIDGNLDIYTTTSQTFNLSDFVMIKLGFLSSASIFRGFISQVLIYSRTLSNSEIQWNYNYPDNVVRNGLVLWLQAHLDYIKDIDGDGVLEWIDLSGFGNHGKIYGAQLVQLIKDASRVIQAQRVLAYAR
jgi:hypothetical protein